MIFPIRSVLRFKDSSKWCRCSILGCIVLNPSEQSLSGAALQGRRGFPFDGWAGGLCAAGGAVQWRGAVVYGLKGRQATGQLLNLKRRKNRMRTVATKALFSFFQHNYKSGSSLRHKGVLLLLWMWVFIWFWLSFQTKKLNRLFLNLKINFSLCTIG